MNTSSFVAFALLLGAMPALASVTVISPASNATVGTTFTLSASAGSCSSQAIAAMGYSLDSSSNTVIVKSALLLANVSAAAGSHVVHVKAWGAQGATCVADVAVKVAPPTLVTNIAVRAPLNGASVTSPFAVSAGGNLCSSQTVTAMGYSLDSSAATTIVNGTSIAGQLTATTGIHIIHVKSWGSNGAACVSNVTVNVAAPPKPPTPPTPPTPPVTTPSGPQIPSNAIAVQHIEKLTNWMASFDTATGGAAASTGTMNLVAAPALSAQARQFVTTYSNYGGERYSVNIGHDSAPQNFVYDASLYLASPTNDIANIEMDLNQVMANGQTVIFGFQCDGWSRTWDYTQNTGTPTNPVDKWLHSNQTCNPQAWTPNAWHRVQVSYSRDSSGNVTYSSVWLDGQKQDLNVTVPSAFALGWGPSLLTNFQVDGMTSTTGSATVYLDNLTIYRW